MASNNHQSQSDCEDKTGGLASTSAATDTGGTADGAGIEIVNGFNTKQ